MKKALLISALVLFNVAIYAQSFKDLYETLEETDRFSNLMNLREYQHYNPDHVIPYFLMGEIYDEYMREINPILMFGALQSDYQQLKTYYGLVKYKLDEKQARQDRDYFGDIEITTDKKKVGLPDILNEVEKRLGVSNQYFTDAKMVHDSYLQCINNYNECLFKYREIMDNYPNYKDLCLVATPKLIQEIKNISLNFDSSLVFFDSYKVACEKFPHILEVNNYALVPIVTYRLEGLIESDFLSSNIQLWDFKTWSDEFIKLIEEDIYVIEKGLDENTKQLDELTSKLLEEEVYSDEFDRFLIDVRFQNLIGKYDYASLANQLIDYKKSKLSFAYNTRSEINDISDPYAFYLINKLWYFQDLALQKEALNKEVSELKDAVSFEQIAKYIDFFGEQFHGMDGFLRWCEIEKYRNDQIFNDNLLNLSEFIARDNSKNEFQDSVLVYKDKQVPFGVQHFISDSLHVDTLLTTGMNQFNNRWHFINGFEIDEDSVFQPFFAKVNPKGGIDWMNDIQLEKVKNQLDKEVFHQKQTDDSLCYVVSKATEMVNDSMLVNYTFLDRFNWEGKKVGQFAYESDLDPVHFWIDEINEEYLLIEQGTYAVDSNQLYFPCEVKLYNFSDSLIWQRNINLKGEIVDVVVSNSNFMLVANYDELTVGSSSLISEEEQQSSAIVFFERNGTLKRIDTFKTPGELQIDYGYKLSSSSLNLVGSTLKEGESASELFYMLTNENGEPILSNSRDLEHQRITF